MRKTAAQLTLLSSLLALCATLRAADWPTWGGDASRNMAAKETGLPVDAEIGDPPAKAEELDRAKAKDVKWVAKLGNQAYGNATVAGGKVFVGTNNGTPRDPAFADDHGVVMCFNEADGKFLWQLLVPKLDAGQVADWEYVGVCSSPAVEGNFAYVVTNRCEILCLDVNGLADGNAGPFTDEAQYVAGPGKPPASLGKEHADIVWRYDMLEELGVFPHNQTSSNVLVVGDRLYVSTSNSVDWNGRHTPAPDAPALICLDRKTGKLLGEERSGISSRLYNSNWSSPAYGTFAGRPLVVFGGGDGWCYAFQPEPVGGVLEEVWRFDCIPAGRRTDAAGKPVKYRDNPDGPCEIIATPVIANERVFVAIGQAPDNGDGSGAVSCIDGTKTGDITRNGKVWQYTDIARSMSTPSVADGLVFLGDFAGTVHCLDEKTGKPCWTFDTASHVWGSTLVAGGHVYVGNENGLVTVLKASKEKQKDPLAEIDFQSPVYSSPVAANGVLYVGTEKFLYALKKSDAK
jgi:outer membrane protein assembly factor BamB